MKLKIIVAVIFFLGFVFSNPVLAKDEERNVPSFSEISLRIPGELHIEQGKKQSIEISAESSTLEKIITEVKGRKLIIRFTNKHFLWNNFKSGKISLYITVPEIDGLSISGSGDIIADKPITTRILNLAVSGSGDLRLANLKAERVKTAISGSGDIIIKDGGVADELSISISGSGNVKASGFKAKEVNIKTAGSGDASVYAVNSLNIRVAGSGDVYYNGSPAIDSSIAGSGGVKKIK
ncbi:MAG: DUF2807 domain-containing protein [Chlorobi bacterium]|nr:DUF2807 domain-containing protein [Chlorobiota bacterium]